jgi:hypothetical protein
MQNTACINLTWYLCETSSTLGFQALLLNICMLGQPSQSFLVVYLQILFLGDAHHVSQTVQMTPSNV